MNSSTNNTPNEVPTLPSYQPRTITHRDSMMDESEFGKLMKKRKMSDDPSPVCAQVEETDDVSMEADVQPATRAEYLSASIKASSRRIAKLDDEIIDLEAGLATPSSDIGEIIKESLASVAEDVSGITTAEKNELLESNVLTKQQVSIFKAVWKAINL